MALHANIEWEIRTAGNNDNGGGFKVGATGVDRCQQDAAHAVLTTASTVHSTTTQINVDAGDYTVSTQDVGNIIQITGGTATAGFYEITAVDTGNNRWTLDRSAGSSGQTVVGRMGGALAHPQTIGSVIVAGNTIHIKSGTYLKVGSNSYVLQSTVQGGSGTPINWIGYNTTRRDRPIGNNRPLFDGNSDTTNCIIAINGNNFFDIRMANATGVGFSRGADMKIAIVNCRASSCGSHGFALGGTFDSTSVISCESDNNTGKGFENGAQTAMFCSYVHDNTAQGVTANRDLNATFSIFANNNSHGVHTFDGAPRLINCILFGNTGGSTDGLLLDGTGPGGEAFVFNTVSKDNGRYGFNRSVSSTVKVLVANFTFANNCYHGNGTAGLNTISASSTDITADPKFVNPAIGDFMLQGDSPLLNAGYDYRHWLGMPT